MKDVAADEWLAALEFDEGQPWRRKP